ncbi:MAG TPA: pirin family protein [Ferruginibacter sp.]|nr:pirin family protein [Bacteroidota bacterium]HRE63816.1 pirin family protein [Ferruginibacter sp.]
MIHKITNEQKVGNAHIKILYPGKALKSVTDTGLGTIGRIDHANIGGNVTIKMHPHINDDILSYFRTGYAMHIDSEGYQAKVSRNKLMLMKAGKIFHHEEHMPEPLEGLQIFIRPKIKDDIPEVSFRDLEVSDSINEWRLLASPDSDSQLKFTSETWIYDISLKQSKEIGIPDFDKSKMTGLLYVFQGEVLLNANLSLTKGESLVFRNEDLKIQATENSELVLFIMNENSTYFDEGMYSGNQY